MLTSKLAIRLSAKLEADKKSLEDAIVGDAMRIGPDDDRVRGGVSLEQDGTDVEGGAAPRNDAASQGATIALDDHLSNQKGSSKEASKASRFAHTTPFETLKDELNTRVVDSQEPGVAQEDHAWWFGETTTTEEGAAMANVTPDWSRQQPFTPLRLMPTWTSTFWPEYENQLRVFGTQEGVCGLTARGRAK
ncbi:hypothetical protein ANO11243_052600 [Dothideomycetidae sp. 11243]|nr:hypothetical protein ANO11243_052600 [fungal sp. No.11243]